MKAIEIKCTGSGNLELKDLTVIQGGIKFLSEEGASRLKKSILKYGFSAPIFIWTSGTKKVKNNILDGTQRVTVLNSLKDEGYEIPPLPVVYIQAKNRNEAKEKLLHITSQYGDFDKKWLSEFLDGITSDMESMSVRLTNEELGLNDVPDFTPENMPEIDSTITDESDIEKASVKLEKQYEGEKELNLVQCPNCGEEFYVTD